MLLDALQSVPSQDLRIQLQAARDKSGMSFQELHPRARAPVTSAADDQQKSREPYVPTGGWASTARADGNTGDGIRSTAKLGCEIDVRAGLSAPEFLMQYLVPGRPVLVRGAASDWGFRRAWSKQKLLHTHGALLLRH